MQPTDDYGRRRDPRGRTRGDLDRRHRREQTGDTFWRSLTLIGSIGWPIVLLGLGGALLGRWLDQLLGLDLVLAVVLLLVGVGVGVLIAVLTVRRTP